MSALATLPPAAAVALIRLRSLGDCVLTTPAIHILKTSRPDLRIGVVVEDRFRAVFDGNPDLAEILPPSLRAVRSFKPELIINLHGGTRSLTLTAASGARLRAGFAHLRGTSVYNLRVPTAQKILGINRRVHTAEHIASVMFWLGAKQQPIGRARLFCPPLVSDAIAVVHPLAATPEKTWPAEHFLRVAELVQQQAGLEPVFIGAPGEDLSRFAQFRTVSGPLEETKALIAGARLFIGNDSGPAHIAAAFGVPSTVIFGPSDAEVWAPWRTEAAVLKAEPISQITPDEVSEKLHHLLAAGARQ